MKKIMLWLITILLFLGCMDMGTTPVNAIKENKKTEELLPSLVENKGVIHVEVKQVIQSDGTHVNMEVTTSTADETVKVISIRSPDESVIEGSNGSYMAPCNGSYEFLITYEENGMEKTQTYVEYVFDSNSMSDGNKPSKANGFLLYADPPQVMVMAGDQDAMTPATGKIYIKFYGMSITVDGQVYGPASPSQHYIAYMQDSEGRSVLCMDPTKSNASTFEASGDITIVDDPSETIENKKGMPISVGDMPLWWFYGASNYGGISDPSAPYKMSSDEWTFITQLMMWEYLGWDYSGLGSSYQQDIDWIKEKAQKHNEWLSDTYDDQTYVKVHKPWAEGTETLDEGKYVNKDKKLNPEFEYEKFDSKTTILSFGDPKYIWGNYKINTQEIEIEGVKVITITSIDGGEIIVDHRDTEISGEMRTKWNEKTDNVDFTWAKKNGGIEYTFSRKGSLPKDPIKFESVAFSKVDESTVGSSFYWKSPIAGADQPQPLMQFAVPFKQQKKVNFMFNESEKALTPPPVVPTPPELEAPDFEKLDDEDRFPIQGATFSFHSNETFKIPFQTHNAVCTWVPTPTEDDPSDGYDDCEWSDWKNSPTKVVYNKGEEVHQDVTGSDGMITSLDEIIVAYRTKEAEIIADTEESNACVRGAKEIQVDPNYVWKGGKFYAMEPDTSYKIFNDNAIKKGDVNFVGYANPTADWEKIPFTIGEKKGDDRPVITHTNVRQEMRLTFHKVDHETNYLNHTNTHEPQGDGYFKGAVYVLIAREDILLHDGSTPLSDFTGKPLLKGEVADVLVLDDNNPVTATSKKLDLGKYALQEVRLPGIYDYEIITEINVEDGLHHVVTADNGAKLLADIQDKNSDFYKYDFIKADELGMNASGMYWYQNYTNEIVNPYNNAYKGGQVVDVDMKYSSQDNVYNELFPPCYLEEFIGKNVKVNDEIVEHTIPKLAVTPDLKTNVGVSTLIGLDYANSIQKGHLQLRKLISEKPTDNGESEPIVNANVKDVYFMISLLSKMDNTIEEPLPDQLFVNKRLDGRVIEFDAKGDLFRNADGEILFKEDGEIVPEMNEWMNPTKMNGEANNIDSQNISTKDLYMILKSNELGNAGTNIPETIVWANNTIYGLGNTGNQGSYGAYDYANPNKLIASGLPLPAGDYVIQELNPNQGYAGVEYQVRIDKDTKDINGIITIDGKETGDQIVDTLMKQFYIVDDRMVESTILDELVKMGIKVSKRDAETGKLIPVTDTQFMIWQWNPDMFLKQDNMRNEWVKDVLVQDEFGDYVCIEGFTVCEYNGKPMEAIVKKEPLPTYNSATQEEKSKGHFQKYKISYVEYEQVPNDPNMPNSPTHTEVTVYDENNDYTFIRDDGKRITAPVGNWVSRKYTDHGTSQVIDTNIYTTNEEGQFTLPPDQPLVVSDYLLCEINAPIGYVISRTPVAFTITAEHVTTPPNQKPILIHVQLDQENMPSKGNALITKKGDVLQGFERYTTLLGHDAWKPIYKVDQVEDFTTFEVYTTEDIIVNGDIKHVKDSLVETIKTDEFGNAITSELYLGKYELREKQAPHGFITDGTPIPFELTYQGQNVPVYPVYNDQVNVRQNIEIRIKKALSNGQSANDIYFALRTKQELKKVKIEHPKPSDSVDAGFTHPERPAEPGIIETDQVPIPNADDDFVITDGIITGYVGTSKTPGIPAILNGEVVLGIADEVFKEKGLTAITLPISLEIIGKDALANNDLQMIEFFDWFYDDGIMKEPMLMIDPSWVNYNQRLEKIIVPYGSKATFDTLLDSDVDDSMEYVPLIEKKMVDFIDEGMTLPTIPDDQTESDVLPVGTLLEIIRIVNGVGLSTLNYPEGDYYLQEIKAPSNVIMSDEMYDVTFKYDESLGNKQIITINNGQTIVNDTTDVPPPVVPPTPSDKEVTIKLKKHFQNGVIEELYKYVTFGLFNSEKVLLYELGLNADGSLIKERFKLKKGDYYLQEIKTHDDYELDKTKYRFTISTGKETIEINNGKAIINKLKPTSNLLIQKIDPDEKKSIQATFEIYDEKMNLLGIYETDKLGQVHLYGLKESVLFIKEIKAQDGYILNDELIEVILQKGETVTIEIENKKKGSSSIPPNPNTGDTRPAMFMVGIFVISGFVFYTTTKKKKK